MNSVPPLISIITPVYNSSVTLPAMLGSVLRQSLEHIEHIVIDDGSTDGSGEMLDDYARSHPRRSITVIHQDNAGESAARNRGLEQARGEYVAFLDHDDCLADNFCKLLYHQAVAEHADICNGETVITDLQGQSSPSSRTNALIRQLGSRLCFFDNFWTAIYKRRLLAAHGLRFDPGTVLGGDLLFQNEALLACTRLALREEAHYIHLHQPGSGSNPVRGLTPRQAESMIAVYTRIAANLADAQGRCEAQGMGYVIWRLIHTLCYRKAQYQEDARRCALCAMELWQNCPAAARPTVRGLLKSRHPEVAAVLRIT